MFYSDELWIYSKSIVEPVYTHIYIYISIKNILNIVKYACNDRNDRNNCTFRKCFEKSGDHSK